MPGSEQNPAEECDESLGLLMVFCLAALAGAVDTYGLVLLKDLYVSFMSGNTTSLGQALAQSDWTRATQIETILVGFIIGAACGEVTAIRFGRRHVTLIIAMVGIILLIPLVDGGAAVLAMTFAMGALNAVMQRAGPVAVSITYVTGSLVKLGMGLGGAVCRQQKGTDWLLQGVPWLGLLFGASLGAIGRHEGGHWAYALVPIAALTLAATTWAIDRGRDPRRAASPTGR